MKSNPHSCENLTTDDDGVEMCGCGHGYHYAITVLQLIRDDDCGPYEPAQLAKRALEVIAGGV